MAYSRSVIFRNKVLAAYKWVLSFRKSDWELKDYPVGIAKRTPDPAQDSSRFALQPYRAYIINWTVVGLGNTPEEAKAKLAHAFASIKAEGQVLTRPGRTRPIMLAPQEKVSKDEALSEDFIQKVLGLDCAWISDESSPLGISRGANERSSLREDSGGLRDRCVRHRVRQTLGDLRAY